MVFRTPNQIVVPAARRRPLHIRALGGALGVVLAVGILAGCAETQAPERPPFEAALQSIAVAKSTRADVLRRLGQPNLTRRGDSLLIYAKFQEGSLFIPVGKRVRRLAIGQWHLLVAQLDDRGVVESVEAPWQTALPNATRTELCILSGECFSVDRAGLVVLAQGEEDAAAKTFAAAPERCTVYAYPGEGREFSAALDGAFVGASSAGTYFQWRVAPGAHELSAFDGGDTDRAERLTVDCTGGETLYVEFGDTEPQLAVVDAARGQDGVSRGRLILDDF